MPFILGGRVDFAQLIKNFQATQTTVRYSPAKISDSEKKPRFGRPDFDKICTSHIERLNLSIRMGDRRFTRLTNAHSKSHKHHVAMQAICFAWYNLCRKHETLGGDTPAMAAGDCERAMDDPETTPASGGSLTPNRFRFGRFSLLLLIAIAVLCAALYPTGRDLILQMNQNARRDAKLEAKSNLVELLREKHFYENDAKEQNRLKRDENWFQRLMSGTKSPPYSDEAIERMSKYYDDQIAEAKKKLPVDAENSPPATR